MFSSCASLVFVVIPLWALIDSVGLVATFPQFLMPEIEFEHKQLPLALAASDNNGLGQNGIGGGGGGGYIGNFALGSPMLAFNDAFNALAVVSSLSSPFRTANNIDRLNNNGQQLLAGDVFTGSFGNLPEPLSQPSHTYSSNNNHHHHNSRQHSNNNRNYNNPELQHQQNTEPTCASSAASSGTSYNNNNNHNYNSNRHHRDGAAHVIDPKQQFEVLPLSRLDPSNIGFPSSPYTAAKFIDHSTVPASSSSSSSSASPEQQNVVVDIGPASTASEMTTNFNAEPTPKTFANYHEAPPPPNANEPTISNGGNAGLPVDDFMAKLIMLAKTLRQPKRREVR